MNKLIKLFVAALLLALLPLKSMAQPNRTTVNEPTISFDITNIANFDERVFFLYNLMTDGRFDVIHGEQDGFFVISASNSYEGINLAETFADFREQNASDFSSMSKEQAAEVAAEYKGALPFEFVSSLMMDYYIRSRQNNTCANADPFCTDNGMYEFPAGVNAGSGESGPDYDCLYTTPNPAWYYMRILNPGNIDIYMYSTPSVDIDFCCWGPFTDPSSPCPNGLTSNKVVSCSYAAAHTEHCLIPATAQTGEYYILVITNYSNQTTNISFSKVAGTGTTVGQRWWSILRRRDHLPDCPRPGRCHIQLDRSWRIYQHPTEPHASELHLEYGWHLHLHHYCWFTKQQRHHRGCRHLSPTNSQLQLHLCLSRHTNPIHQHLHHQPQRPANPKLPMELW